MGMTWYETFYVMAQGLALASWIALPFGLWLIQSARVKKHAVSNSLEERDRGA